MLVDDDLAVREKAVGRILEIRERTKSLNDCPTETMKQNKRSKGITETSKKAKTIRVFRPPFKELILNAEHFWEMVPWEDAPGGMIWTEPPVTMMLSIEELYNYMPPKFPNHNQFVEFNVKLSTQVCKSVADEDRRNGDMIIGHKSRMLITGAKTKRDYKKIL